MSKNDGRNFATSMYLEHLSTGYDPDTQVVTDAVRQDVEYAMQDLQIPNSYVIHDKDTYTKKDIHDFMKNNPTAKPEDCPKLGDRKKPHAQVLMCYGSNTTLNSIQTLVNSVALKGHEDIVNGGYIVIVKSVKGYYDYLIHCREQDIKDGKHEYDVSERHDVNGFDIQDYIGDKINVGDGQRIKILSEAAGLIHEMHFTNVGRLIAYITDPSNGYSEQFQKACFDKSTTLNQMCIAEFYDYENGRTPKPIVYKKGGDADESNDS